MQLQQEQIESIRSVKPAGNLAELVNTNVDLSGYAGGVMRLIFEWKNDSYGGDSLGGCDR
jgi:hypothetical protein